MTSPEAGKGNQGELALEEMRHFEREREETKITGNENNPSGSHQLRKPKRNQKRKEKILTEQIKAFFS